MGKSEYSLNFHFIRWQNRIEVIAFTNTDAAVLYIGIDNDGNAVELSNVDDEYTRITNGIRDAILPDVTMFMKYII